MLKHEIISPASQLPVFFNYYQSINQLIPSHWHQHVEVVYILNGSMDIVLNDGTYTLYEKDMFVINSGFIHLTKTRETTTVLLLQIPIELLDQSLPQIEQIQFQAFFSYKQLKQNDYYMQMKSCLLEMLTIFQIKELGYPFLFNSQLQQYLYLLFVHFSVDTNTLNLPSGNKHRIHLQKAIDYVALHYFEPLSLSEIASYLSLNPEYFCRIFKKNMGFTFLEYLNQIRLTHIYDDLMTTSDSITQIQERHGFTNYKVFNRMFKESYGCTPSVARRNK